MKRSVLSKPDLKWEGFQPVPYWLNRKKACDLALTRKADDGKTDQPTRVGDVFVLLKDKTLKPESFERFGWKMNLLHKTTP